MPEMPAHPSASKDLASEPSDVSVRVNAGHLGVNLIHLPGVHGDWTLIGGFRRALGRKVSLVEWLEGTRPEFCGRNL